MKTSHFFSNQEKEKILEAIKIAEKDTSGEIRVHLESTCKGDVLDRAAQMFSVLKMHKTEQRNGVLFYLAIKDRKFAIIGDVGINKVVPNGFWDEIKETMKGYFTESKFTEGLIKGILMAGEKLKANFPYQFDDVNELSDDISFENN